MSGLSNVCLYLTAFGVLAGGVQSCPAASFPVPLDPVARNLIHISTRPRSADSVFIDVRIEESNPRTGDVRLKLSGIRLNVMRRTMKGAYQSLVSTRIDSWRRDGALHAYFAIDPELIESSTLDLVIDAPGLPGENYHAVQLKDFIKREGPAAPPDGAGMWSATTQNLEARITLVEKAKINGTRSLVPYLELRNVGESASPLKVRCGSAHVTFELVGTDGKVVREGQTLPRSGPHADPGTIVLPHDSSIRIGMYCSNWGVPKDMPAMVSTDSGAWVLQSHEKGNVFLRAKITGANSDSDPHTTWRGTIITPQVKIDWNE